MIELYDWITEAVKLWMKSDSCAMKGEWPPLDKWHYITSHTIIAWQYRLGIPVVIFIALRNLSKRFKFSKLSIATATTLMLFFFFCGEGHILQSNTFVYPNYRLIWFWNYLTIFANLGFMVFAFFFIKMHLNKEKILNESINETLQVFDSPDLKGEHWKAIENLKNAKQMLERGLK